MKRFWVFNSAEWEAGTGLSDLIGSCATRKAAIALARESEWGWEWVTVFDSKTGKQYDYRGKDGPTVDIIESWK